MLGRMIVYLTGVLAMSLMAPASPAVEPWADTRLTVPAGIELWLDAEREAAARESEQVGWLKSRTGLSAWHDGSGLKRDLEQVDPSRQPKLMQIGASAAAPSTSAGWVVRFDGQDDHLRVLGLNRRLTEFTLFVVGAPHSNLGGFRGWLSCNQIERKDYETGFNLDLNAPASAALQNLNLEGRGFGGARNLMQTTVPFGTLHVIEAVADARQKQVRLTFDGKDAGTRPFDPSELVVDELTLGARHVENAPATQRIRGFLHGDIAEVLLFGRVLSAAETQSVRTYLEPKHAELKRALPRELQLGGVAENAEPLVTVADPPPVQMLVPGFTVRAIPLELTNINNLRYRPDGKLYALGYDGNIWLLSDADGDGLPDAATQFFENNGRLRGPIGMAVIPAGHALLADAVRDGKFGARGVVVASKGKVSAILDADGDDVAETERVIASGWKEIPQNVDAIGVAIHPQDGAIYFGLGTAAYNNAYLLDAEGKSAFDLGSERGTIQRIAPDLSRRETICTGVRFTIGLEFNADRELFATDQEGATWLPNGNPFDELLHIQPGRHYGFPPRHPRHLPNVLDEPNLFDYVPQHQSTCGMAFNLPLQPDGPIFGPAAWRGDALICGESRGKLYRTRLTKDDDGRYVAQNYLIACLNMLTVDCCLSPRGDLLVACHSGGPDWGTGPSGKGRLFSIRYADTPPPQPLGAWAAGPQEVRVAFDQPLHPQQLKNVAAEAKITYGEYVAAGDRFESLRPGYAVTQLQQSTPRYRLPIYSASITPDRRTLILSTAPHSAALTYALALPGFGRETKPAVAGELPQLPQIDLAYSVHGVRASWEPRDKRLRAWEGWLPHLDFAVSHGWRTGDAEQDRFWEVIKQPGTLTLTTQVDPRGLLYPAVQPGSKLDYERHEDHWIKQQALLVRSTRPFSLASHHPPREQAVAAIDDRHQATVVFEQTTSAPVPISVRLETDGEPLTLTPSWQAKLADGEIRTGSLALHRWLLPWAEINPSEPSPSVPRVIPELAGASWGRGRRVFFSDEAGCAKCHVAHRSGGQIGADLSNLFHRDYTSVLRDITLPSFAINPDYITYVVALHDGRVLSGTVRSDGERLLIGDKDGKVTAVARVDVEEMQPSAVSVMPEGLPNKLGPERMKDLLAFLLLEPPRMPHDAPLPAPPPRRRAEFAAVLAGPDATSPSPKPPRPLHVLLVAGPKDHGPGEHDYPAWLRVWGELLAGAEGVTVSTAMEWPSPDQLRAAETIVFFQKGSWTPERAQAIDAHLAKGGGLVYIHWAVEGGADAAAFAQRIGLASHAAKLKYRHGPLDLGFDIGRSHPIGRNFDKVHFHDESYWLMQGDPSQIRVIATGVEDAEPRPLFWCFEPNRGRVFVSILGHYSWTFDDPLFRVLLLRGIAWSANESVDRLNDLATIGVQLSD